MNDCTVVLTPARGAHLDHQLRDGIRREVARLKATTDLRWRPGQAAPAHCSGSSVPHLPRLPAVARAGTLLELECVALRKMPTMVKPQPH